MSKDKMFETAGRIKLRFNTCKGMLNTEDLWVLSLEDLNTVAKSINKLLKDQKEEDFLKEQTEADAKTALAFEIVIHVLDTKKAEVAAREQLADRKVKKAKLLALLEKKQDEGLEGLSEKELKKQIDAL